MEERQFEITLEERAEADRIGYSFYKLIASSQCSRNLL